LTASTSRSRPIYGLFNEIRDPVCAQFTLRARLSLRWQILAWQAGLEYQDSVCRHSKRFIFCVLCAIEKFLAAYHGHRKIK
jgi:hypothetical protein